MKKNATGSNIKLMKKALVFLLICFSLVSCGTTVVYHNDKYTAEDADYALHVCIETANENARSIFYNRLFAEESFIPSRYKALFENNNTIPGMATLAESYRTSISSFILDRIQSVFEFADKKVKNISFKNPMNLVTSSDTSISDAFLNMYRSDIKSQIEGILKEADFSMLDKLILKYNSYVQSLSFIGENHGTALEATDYSALLSEYITNLYCNDLRQCEELFRTTPSPYYDNKITRVFGNF